MCTKYDELFVQLHFLLSFINNLYFSFTQNSRFIFSFPLKLPTFLFLSRILLAPIMQLCRVNHKWANTTTLATKKMWCLSWAADVDTPLLVTSLNFWKPLPLDIFPFFFFFFFFFSLCSFFSLLFLIPKRTTEWICPTSK